MATKEEILALEDLGFIEVPVPEWGGKVMRLKAMSGATRDQFELSTFQDSEAAKKAGGHSTNVRARMAVFSLVNEEGALLFTEADIPALGAKSAKALDRIYDAAQKLNGYTRAEAEKLEKN